MDYNHIHITVVAVKRISTFDEVSQREDSAGKSLYGVFGTYLGASHEAVIAKM